LHISGNFASWLLLMTQPKISIVTYCGEHALLQEMLTGLIAQDAAPEDFEVVIVDYDPDTDSTQYATKFVSDHPQLALRYLRIQNGSRARALNFGAQHAEAAVIVLLADDFLPAAGLVSAHLKFHEENPAREAVGIGPGFFPEHLRDCKFR